MTDPDLKYDTAVSEAREVIDVALGHGMSHIVLSPGSRNAPLLIAASSRVELKKHIVVDERTAAFVALGIATTSGKPVGLVCTSGTALLNYAPAVAEAYYRNIPLIVISADRPEEWIDQDDSQTIRQFEALRNFVKNSYDLEASGLDEISPTGLANRLANDAMFTALSGPRGPVHINLRFPEPLGKLTACGRRSPRIITSVDVPREISRDVLKQLGEEARDKKILVVCGFMNPDHKMIRALKELEEIPNVCVMAESLANFTGSEDAHVIDIVLSRLTEEKEKLLAPDIVVSVGGALVSRKLKEFLRRSDARHWGVGFFKTTVDCFRSLSKRIEAEPAPFMRGLASVLRGVVDDATPTYAVNWRMERRSAIDRRERLVKEAPWCELKAFEILSRYLGRDMNLHLSNGTSVRYGQLFDFDVHATYSNRGVSGIDGSTATAIGSAIEYSGTTILVTGDMSFSYDLGALGSNLAPDCFKIIVINNCGGAIFRFVGSTSSLDEEIRERYFCADSHPPVKELADAFGWSYASASSEDQLNRVLPHFLSSDRRGILEIKVPADTGAEQLRLLLS